MAPVLQRWSIRLDEASEKNAAVGKTLVVCASCV